MLDWTVVDRRVSPGLESDINIKRVKRLGSVKRLMHKRGVKAALVATLTVSAVLGGSEAAFAAGDYDYMPGGGSGYYNSSDDGARAGIGASGSNVTTDGQIQWIYQGISIQNTQVHVQIRLKDTLCDGDAPVVKVEFMYGAYVSYTRAWIYTGGCGTSILEHATFDATSWGATDNVIDDNMGIRITVCNGGQRGTVNEPGPFDFCGTQHGPFHHDPYYGL